jgi:hypothetical protein
MTTQTANPKSRLVTAKTVPTLANKPGRHPIANAKGLFLTVKPSGLCYWTYRFRLDGRETELSLGALSEMSLEAAIQAHAEQRAMVLRGIDPRGDKRPMRRPAARGSDAPAFAEAAERLIARRESEWRSAKHLHQWKASLMSLPAAFRAMRADRIGVEDVYNVLMPIWTTTPSSARRIRARIEAVLDSTRKANDTHPNPAAWSGWLKDQLGKSKVNRDPVTGARASHAAMPSARIPALMARLDERPDQASNAPSS